MGFRIEILVVYRKQPVTLRVRRQRQQIDSATFVTPKTLNGKKPIGIGKTAPKSAYGVIRPVVAGLE